ncbi:MAG: hypothetical protein CVU56_27895 [Deltaproteobacteria bacterium HGW-Deltaproteobacteria-14]|jgi:purine-binding chemotaxis protein CheW|nr:MAG: hypothetical protein CVU56_27895 [Deltaproteobacteria bacterium HGW-Deltaproteobacteria-14]
MDPLATGTAAEALYVVFSAARHLFALPHHVVERMVTPPRPVRVPDTDHAVLGLINLRGDVLGLVCLRRLIGAEDLAAQNAALLAELAQQERAHAAWVAELDAATQERRPFALSTDPHACAFGRWHDAQDPSDDEARGLTGRFDEPHQRVHAVAHEVTSLTRRGRHEEALALIARARSRDLGALVRRFAEVREILAGGEREIAVVLRLEGRAPIALLVDAVESVSALDTTRSSELGGQLGRAPLCMQLASDADGRLVNLLAVAGLYASVAA